MIRLEKAFLVAVAVGASVLAAQAQPAISVMTVSLADAYDGYYKTMEANNKLRDAQEKAQEQIEALNQEGNVLVESYQEMVEQSKNTALTEDARTKATEDAQRKMEEIQTKQAEVTQFGQNTQRALAQRQKTHRDLMFDEIIGIVTDMAKEQGATMVFDTSGPSVFGAPVLLYSDDAFDVTEELLEILNQDAPEVIEVEEVTE
ncbi:MAG: OmpH family outer membrane protein [Verrucomicrobia bacterium]|nr:MAG: OmpH family outer membrane protein [Verrucomicrobiota bacterium]